MRRYDLHIIYAKMNQEEYNKVICNLLENNDLQEAKKIHITHNFKINNLDNKFMYACLNGHIEVAKWLYELGVDIHIENDIFFRSSCSSGQIEVAIWLYELGANIHIENDEVFIRSCERGQIEIAKWLYELGANIHIGNDFAFRWSCAFG